MNMFDAEKNWVNWKIIMAKQQKVNKRILRCEYAEIGPASYMPDVETQERLSPNRIAYEIPQYVAGHVETEGFVVPKTRNC